MNKRGTIRLLTWAIIVFTLLTITLPVAARDEMKNSDYEKYFLYLNIRDQVLTVYEKDDDGEYTRIVRRMLCTSGAELTPTPTGTYRLGGKERFGKFANFDNEYARYWTQIVRGIYLHSIMFGSRNEEKLKSNPYSVLGSRASHGCIRLYVEDAKWLYYNACPGTRITIGNDNRISPDEKKLLRSTLSFADYKVFQANFNDQPEQANKTAWVCSDGTAMRTGNGSNDRYIGRLKPGTPVEVLQEGDPWVKVLVNEREGYVKRIDVTYEEGKVQTYESGRATKTTTTIYAEPNLKSEELCRIPRDTSLNILETDPENGWYKIQYWSTVGYIRIRNTRVDRSMFQYDEAAQLEAFAKKKALETGIVLTPTPEPAPEPTASATRKPKKTESPKTPSDGALPEETLTPEELELDRMIDEGFKG